jgi:putative transcriptional regulator
VAIMSPGIIRNRISEVAGRRRINIKDLANAAGISYQTAYSLYHDRTSRIDFETMAGLCRALNVTVGELFEYAPEGNDQ